MKLALVLISALGLVQNSFGSAMVHLDDVQHTLTVSSHIYYYGPVANEDIAQKTTAEINRYWNGGTNRDATMAPFSVTRNGQLYTVKFDVVSEVITEAAANAMMKGKVTSEMNFIKLLQGDAKKGDRSFMNDLCSNQGTWYLSDDLGKSTTAPHEFGHGYCLPHPNDGDWRKKGQPGIMCPRGTIVQSQYQWDPKAQAGAAGGTMSPYTRKVIEENIKDLRLESLSYDAKGNAPLVRKSSRAPHRIF